MTAPASPLAITDLPAILAAHTAWLKGEPGGARAYLRGANLSGAYLSGAYLSEANLREANLRGADLREADLREADLREAGGIYSLYVPGMSTRGDYLYAVQHDTGLMVKAGCWWGTLDEFEAVCREKGRDKYLAAVAFLREVTK